MNRHVSLRSTAPPPPRSNRHQRGDEPDTDVLHLAGLRAAAPAIPAPRLTPTPQAPASPPRQAGRDRPALRLPTWDPLPPRGTAH